MKIPKWFEKWFDDEWDDGYWDKYGAKVLAWMAYKRGIREAKKQK